MFALASGVPTGLHPHSWLCTVLLPLLHGWHPETRHLVLLYPGKFVTPIDTVSAGGWLVCHTAGLVSLKVCFLFKGVCNVNFFHKSKLTFGSGWVGPGLTLI